MYKGRYALLLTALAISIFINENTAEGDDNG